MIGLNEDGTVFVMEEQTIWGPAYLFDELKDWEDIVAVCVNYPADLPVSSHFAVGLQKDGTVLAEGSNEYGQCEVLDWKYQCIEAIAAGGRHTVGLRWDGTVVAVGDNRKGQCNVGRWVKEPTSILFGLKLKLRTWRSDWKLF